MTKEEFAAAITAELRAIQPYLDADGCIDGRESRERMPVLGGVLDEIMSRELIEAFKK